MDDKLEQKVLLKIMKDIKEIKETKQSTDVNELKQIREDLDYLCEAVGMLLEIQTEQVKNGSKYKGR